MLNIGLVSDRIRWEEKILIQTAKKNRIRVTVIDPKTICMDVEGKLKSTMKPPLNVVIQRCISYFRGLHITSILENSDVTVVNPFKVSLICGNKLFATLALRKFGIPVPKTLIAFTWEGASKALKEIGYPAVIKPVIGSWGRLIGLIKDRDSAQAIIESRELMRNPLMQIYYIQEYVRRPPRDLRVLAVGDEIVAASYRYSPKNDWRTNVARGARSEICQVTSEIEEIVLKATEAVGKGVLAVDCMESPKGLMVHEVNSTVEFRGLYSATGIDIPSKILHYTVKVMKK